MSRKTFNLLRVGKKKEADIIQYCLEDVLCLVYAYNHLRKDTQYLEMCEDNRDLERGQMLVKERK